MFHQNKPKQNTWDLNIGILSQKRHQAQSEAERWKGLERMELSDNLGRFPYVENQRKAFYRAIGKYEKA